MNKSDQIDQLADALAKAQEKLRGPVKDSKNPFFKSTYADLASCWDSWQEVGPKNGLAITQFPSFTQELVMVTTMIMHKSGQWISETLSMPIVKRDPQGVGSALTYCRRYSLMAMVGMAPEDDDGNRASNNGHQPAAQPAPHDENAELMRLTDRWLQRCQSNTDPVIFDGLVGELAGLPKQIQPACKQIVWERTKQLGLIWDKERRTFFMPAPVADSGDDQLPTDVTFN